MWGLEESEVLTVKQRVNEALGPHFPDPGAHHRTSVDQVYARGTVREGLECKPILNVTFTLDK